jgi:hypothetical protein
MHRAPCPGAGQRFRSKRYHGVYRGTENRSASRGQFREARADERPLFIGTTSAFVALQHVSGYHAAVVVGVMLLFALSDIRQPSSHQGIGWRTFCSDAYQEMPIYRHFSAADRRHVLVRTGLCYLVG